MAECDEQEERRSFTSWKFDLLDAMSSDERLRGDPFRFAFRLLQHVNRQTMTAWPAIEKLAADLGISRHQAQKHARLLCDSGWLERDRPNRREAYCFRFLEGQINRALDARELRLEELNEVRQRRFEVADSQRRNSFDVADPLTLDVADPLTLDVADPQHKHLNQNYLIRTPEDSISEEDGKNLSYGTGGNRHVA